MDRYNGVLPVNKDPGMTSHDVVSRLRRITGQKKIGHTGTLDPQATGLLLTCFGRATKLSQFLTGLDKLYWAEITLGAVSDTFDGNGKIEEKGTAPYLTKVELQDLLKRFTGRISQKVPAYSAVRVGGRALYKQAREGMQTDRPERKVEIKSIDIISIDMPHLTLRVHCSKGTYIRSLADDIGREIGCGGYLSALERRSVGRFNIETALTLDDVAARWDAGSFADTIWPIEKALDFPTINIRNRTAEAVKHGINLSGEDIISWDRDFRTGDLISVADERGDILAIGKSKRDASRLKADGIGDFFSYMRVLI
jgi:tRNA pseudouridine55 synthase